MTRHERGGALYHGTRMHRVTFFTTSPATHAAGREPLHNFCAFVNFRESSVHTSHDGIPPPVAALVSLVADCETSRSTGPASSHWCRQLSIDAQPRHDSVNTMHLHSANSPAVAYHLQNGHPLTHRMQGPTNPMTHPTMPLSSHVASRIFQHLCQPQHLTNPLWQQIQTTTNR